MNASPPSSPNECQDDEDSGVSFADLLIYIGLERRIFLLILGAGTLISALLAFSLPRYFVARAVLLPPQQQQSAAGGALAQLGALTGMSAVGGSVKSPEELYVAFMKTRRIQDTLVQKLGLQGRFELPTREAARLELSNRVSITADKKTGLILIEAEDRDAAFAAKLANHYIDELKTLLSVVAVTDAQQRRVFFEQQVTKTQRALGDAEQAFRVAQARGGMVVSQALAEGGIKESAALRAQVAAREVQLAALSRFATAENPDVARLEAELRALRSQLAQMEVGRPRAQPASGGQEAVQAYRDMKVQEAMLDALIRQFEMAKVDESREGPLIQTIDPALPPERPVKPKRSVVLVSGMLISLLLGLSISLARGAARQGGSSMGWARVRAAWR